MLGENGTVDLEQAWRWTCPDCGTVNFCVPQAVAPLPPDEVPEGFDGCDWVASPTHVMCKNTKCMHSFKAEPIS